MLDLSKIFEVSNIYFVLELIVAEFIFFFACPKRKFFILRYIAAVGVCVLLAYFFPMPRSIKYDVYYSILRFVVLFGYTVAVAAVSFKVNVSALILRCVAGYAVQHISYQVVSIITHNTEIYFGAGGSRSILAEITFFPLIYAVMFFVFGVYAAKNESYKNNDWRLILLSAVTLFICVGLMRFSRFNGGQNISNSLYAITCCLLVLFMQFNLYRIFELKQENESIKFIWKEEKKQYEISKGTIELVNVKYHDLKRRLDSINGLTKEEMNSLRDTLQLYDSSFKTGNEVIDVILTQNSLTHRNQGIEFTFMGDGSILSFMTVTDIYSLFGNALENAVEAALKLEDKNKRVISVTLETKGDFIVINFVNYYSGEIAFSNSLPVTTKQEEEGFHGFGMKSIKLISEKYHGDLKVTADGELFTLNVYLMQ